jgi:hypothetical protein
MKLAHGVQSSVAVNEIYRVHALNPVRRFILPKREI